MTTRGEKWSLTSSCSIIPRHEDGKGAMSRRTLLRMTDILALIDAEIAALQQARALIAGTEAKKGPGRTIGTGKKNKKTKLSPEAVQGLRLR